MRIGLKIDVDTYPGAKQGVPALLRLLDDYGATATFFFSLGPDNFGRLLLNDHWPRTISKHLPLSSKFYGTLLPPPVIGKRLARIIKSVSDAGHEVGIRPFDFASWLRHAAHANEQQTRQSFERAIQAFEDLFGYRPKAHAAAHWQVNPHLFALEQQHKLVFSADCRGQTAFFPELQDVRNSVLQLPVTLPTIGELLQRPDTALDNLHEELFFASQKPLPQGQVFNLCAEMEGRAWLPVMERLLTMWKGSQRDFQTLGQLADAIDRVNLPTCQVGWGKVEGGESHVAMQSIRATR